ncbi:MAG: hypothetical protein MjAS7_1920 [Metallosphaera javensis (ex Sakai et al. 2022)]|nr:MAG: hypothetical protein MjAS7_1920 [Metallosphaera javensis (ex Sakai et al. 2022)]
MEPILDAPCGRRVTEGLGSTGYQAVPTLIPTSTFSLVGLDKVTKKKNNKFSL